MLGDRLKQIRKEKGLSQKAFADPLATSSGYISEVEQGKKTPGSEFLLSLSRVWKVSIDWLLTGEGSPYMDTSLPDRMDEGPVIAELLNAVRTVLKSGDPATIDALERNIRYFARAIEVERRYNALETRISALEQERKKAAERIREGDPLEEKDEIIKMRAI